MNLADLQAEAACQALMKILRQTVRVLDGSETLS